MIRADEFRAIHLSYICQLNMFDIDIKAEQFINVINTEYHLLEYSSINGPSYISVTGAINLDIMVKADRFIRILQPSHIILLNNQDIVIKTEEFIKTITIELHLLHISSIIQASYVFMTTTFSVDIVVKEERFIRTIFTPYIDLLNNLDIDIKAERFIITFHSSYIHLIKGIKGQAPSGDHQQTLKSYHGASSMSTSVEHIIHVQDIAVKRVGHDIQTSCIYLTVFNILKAASSKYFIINKSIIYNYFHIVLLALHQWEALGITHSCPSGNGASKSHCIEWKDIIVNIVDSNFCEHHLIHWDEPSCHLIKRLYNHIMSISHQEFIGIIYSIYIKAVQDQLTITDINEVQHMHSIIQSNSVKYINYIISKKKDYHIIVDTSSLDIFNLKIILLNNTFNILTVNIINIIPDDIFEYIDYTHLVSFNNINVNQQFNIIIQEDNYILDNTIQIDTCNYYIPFSHFTDISNKDINTYYIVGYLINKIITTESVISIQFQRLIYNQLTSFFILQQLNIIYHTGNVLNIHHKLDFHLENYITSTS